MHFRCSCEPRRHQLHRLQLYLVSLLFTYTLHLHQFLLGGIDNRLYSIESCSHQLFDISGSDPVLLQSGDQQWTKLLLLILSTLYLGFHIWSCLHSCGHYLDSSEIALGLQRGMFSTIEENRYDCLRCKK